MTLTLSLIVEGHGEVLAAPILVRRISAQLAPEVAVTVSQPIRVPKTRLMREGEIERAVELAARKTAEPGGILVLFDADDECPARLGPRLLRRVQAARPDRRLALVLAKREFEAWFLAAADSLAGARGLASGLTPPEDPEEIRGAKEWLSSHMRGERKYRETLDQPALASKIDLESAERAPSFRKLRRDLAELLQRARQG